MSERLTLASPAQDAIAFNQLYKPHGAYASTHEKEVRVFQDADIKYGDQVLSGAIRHAILGDMAVTFMLSECRNVEEFCTELVLYSHPRLLRPLQGISVPFIIKSYESQAGSHGLAMEVPHHHGWHTAEGPLSRTDKDSIVRAYRLIHAQGVLHGDIRLENILINDEGEVTIVDFGKGRCASEIDSLVVKRCKPCDLAYEMRKILFILDLRDARSTEYERSRASLLLGTEKPYSSDLISNDQFYIPLSTLRSWQAYADAAAKTGTKRFSIPRSEDVRIRRHQGGSNRSEFTMPPAQRSGWTQMERSHLEHIFNAISSLPSDGPVPLGRPTLRTPSRPRRRPARLTPSRSPTPHLLIHMSRSSPPSPKYDTELASRKRRHADCLEDVPAAMRSAVAKRIRLFSPPRRDDRGSKSDDEVQVYRRSIRFRRIRHRALSPQRATAAAGSRGNRDRIIVRRLVEVYEMARTILPALVPSSGSVSSSSTGIRTPSPTPERETPIPANDWLHDTDRLSLPPLLDEELEKRTTASNDDSASSENGDDNLLPEGDLVPPADEMLPPNTSETSTFIRPFSVVLVDSDLTTTIFHAAQDVFHYVANFLHLRPDPPPRVEPPLPDPVPSVEQPSISPRSEASMPSLLSPKTNDRKRKRQDDGSVDGPPLKRTKYTHMPSNHSDLVSHTYLSPP